MRLAYLINQYPKVSHSFIRREIMGLERQGIAILRVALRGWDAELVDEEDFVERKQTCYVLREGAPQLLLAALRLAMMRPFRFARALRLAVKMSRRAERPLPVHLVYLAEACWIEARVRDADVDHLHAHFGTNAAEVAMLLHVLGGPPWSFTVHGPEEFEKALSLGLAEKLRRCAFVVAVSSYGRSQLYQLIDQALWSKVHVVHCGLDKDFLISAEKPSFSRQLICVGRLCRQKGQLLLIEAAHRLFAAGVDFDLVFAGDGELRAAIEKLIAEYKLKPRIRITGWISGSRVRDEILAARAMVLPSFSEGLPVALMEAMGLRRPVISTYVGGIPELIIPGRHGWLVPAGDAEAMAGAMRACLETPPEELTRMSEAAYRRVLKRHDGKRETAKLANLFEELVHPIRSRRLA